MKLALDTNVLIYAHLEAFPEHRVVRAFMLAKLAEQRTRIYLAPLVIREFLHIVTDSKRFAAPLSVIDAVKIARTYVNKSNVECLAENEATSELTLELLEAHNLGRKRIADAGLAAMIIHHGVTHLATCNAKDYQCFSDFLVIDPLQRIP